MPAAERTRGKTLRLPMVTLALVDGALLTRGCTVAGELGMALRTDLQVTKDAWQLQTPTTLSG